MFLEILAPIGPFVSICIRIPIHGSLHSRNKNKRIEPFLLTLFQIGFINKKKPSWIKLRGTEHLVKCVCLAIKQRLSPNTYTHSHA
ncbi:hypothetical protein GYH30_013028 [Glycine max]|uniref:Uncharacterized protein n=1 Tax=Glycine max TaxID=3847 RepID=A0A0R0K5D2_SOYBN|nr:hypothetical protein GYH30_013028 [Glycine max]